jgi:hypothetical protein
MSLFIEQQIPYPLVGRRVTENWKKPGLVVISFLGTPAIPLLIKAAYSQWFRADTGDYSAAANTTRGPATPSTPNEPKGEEDAGTAAGGAQDPQGPASGRCCPYSSAATAADPGAHSESASASAADPGGASDTSRPPCPRCSCSCNNDKEDTSDKDADDDSTGNDKHEDQNSSSNTTTTTSTNPEPKVTFQSVVFFTLQSFPEALRAVERNLVYNFGPLR